MAFTTTTTITLPPVSIGGYGARLRTLSDEEVAQEWFKRNDEVAHLTRELAAAVARRDVAQATSQARFAQKGQS